MPSSTGVTPVSYQGPNHVPGASTASLAWVRRIRIPFVNTAPLTDVHLLIALAPFFWLLGIEQFVAVPVLAWSVTKHFLLGRRVVVRMSLILLVTMIVVMLLSATSIDSWLRSMTFLRTTAMYVMGLFLAVIITGNGDNPERLRSLLRTLVLMMAAASALALLGVVGVADFRFRSLAGYLLPTSLADTDYGNQIVWRFLGNPSWFSGLGSYFRVSGIFLFSTMCAAATAITVPLVVYFVVSSRGLKRLVYVALLVVCLVSLVYTTGRVASISLILAGAASGLLALRLMPRVLALLLVAALAGTAYLALPTGFVADAIESTVYARGAGSATSRTTIYVATVAGLMERPFLGWGTERDITTVDNFALPAGSHSYYLGFAYKHGLLGLAVLLTFLVVVTGQIWSALRLERTRERAGAMRALGYVSWSLLVALLIGATSALDLDATLALIVWVILFSGLQLQRLLHSAVRHEEPASGSSTPVGT